MNLLEEFNTEFIKRHDFYSAELDVLFGKWESKVKLKNIPEAWIIPIDDMLLELEKINVFPDNIEQDFGQLLVLFKLNMLDSFSDKQISEFNQIFKETLEKIKSIDEDLYLYFDIDAEDVKFQYFKKFSTPLYN